MPMNEARGYGAAHDEERAEAHAQILGNRGKHEMSEKIYTQSSEMLHPSDIEKVRQMVAEYDRKNSNMAGVKEFDLNNPPKEPYQHQEYPKHVFHHAKDKNRLVKNEAELKAALKAGYSVKPKPLPVEKDDLVLDEEDEPAIVPEKPVVPEKKA